MPQHPATGPARSGTPCVACDILWLFFKLSWLARYAKRDENFVLIASRLRALPNMIRTALTRSQCSLRSEGFVSFSRHVGAAQSEIGSSVTDGNASVIFSNKKNATLCRLMPSRWIRSTRPKLWLSPSKAMAGCAVNGCTNPRQQVPHGVAYHQPIKVFCLEFVSAQRRDRCCRKHVQRAERRVPGRMVAAPPPPSPPFSETRNASTFQSLPFSCVHIVPRYCNSTPARRCGSGMPRAAKSYQYLNSTHVFLVLEFNQIQAVSVDLREAVMARLCGRESRPLYYCGIGRAA